MVSYAMAQYEARAALAADGVRYAWIITAECEREWDENDNPTDVWTELVGSDRTAGPSDVTDEELALAECIGTPFRLDYGGDGPAARGLMWASDSPGDASFSEACWAPHDDYGMGNYGAPSILWMDSSGRWCEL